MIPELKRGFCGSSLYTSSLVIAWIQVIAIVVLILFFAVSAVFGFSNPDDFFKSWNKSDIFDDHSAANEEFQRTALMVFFVILGLLLFFAFLIDAGLLYGIHKRNHCIMMPYLILGGAVNVINVLSALGMLISVIGGTIAFSAFLSSLLATGFSCYCWLILYSHFQEVKEANLRTQNTFHKMDF